MVPFANIVCGTDLSEPSDEALRQASALASATGARLTLLHAATFLYGAGGAPIPPLAPLIDPDEFRQRTSSQIRAQMARAIPGREAQVEVVIENDSEAGAIVRRAEARQADLIVVGSRGATGLRRMALGSVAESVVRHAHCPVLIARPSPLSREVLVATDLSASSLLALPVAYEEARRRKARLTVLHCLDLPPTMMSMGFAPAVPADPEDPHSRAALAKQATLQVRSALSNLGVVADVLIDPGWGRVVIPDSAERLPAELVVVGTRGRTGIQRMLLGSVAESVVRHAPCSVLVVRGNAAAAR